MNYLEDTHSIYSIYAKLDCAWMNVAISKGRMCQIKVGW